VLLLLVIGLLAVPLTVVYSIHRTEETRGQVRFEWLFGLVRFRLGIPRPAKAHREPGPAGRKKAKSPGKKGVGRRLYPLIRQPAFRRRVFKFGRDVLRATHARDLFVRFRIGLGDPADTGRLWAVVGPIAGMAQNLRGAVVRIEPEFADPVFEVESEGQFRLVPIQFIVLTLGFLLSPTTWHAWWQSQRGNA
jgi:hypothetical protein